MRILPWMSKLYIYIELYVSNVFLCCIESCYIVKVTSPRGTHLYIRKDTSDSRDLYLLNRGGMTYRERGGQIGTKHRMREIDHCIIIL